MSDLIKMTINDVMTVAEACERYNVNINTLREYLKGARVNVDIEAEKARGSIKYFVKQGGSRGEWLVSADFMERVFLGYELPTGYENRVKIIRDK